MWSEDICFTESSCLWVFHLKSKCVQTRPGGSLLQLTQSGIYNRKITVSKRPVWLKSEYQTCQGYRVTLGQKERKKER